MKNHIYGLDDGEYDTKVVDDRKTVLTRNSWNHKGRIMSHVGKYRYRLLLILVLSVSMTLYDGIYTHFT